jgi:hypothetical protein
VAICKDKPWEFDVIGLREFLVFVIVTARKLRPGQTGQRRHPAEGIVPEANTRSCLKDNIVDETTTEAPVIDELNTSRNAEEAYFG